MMLLMRCKNAETDVMCIIVQIPAYKASCFGLPKIWTLFIRKVWSYKIIYFAQKLAAAAIWMS